jgi:hypothetical protein
MFGSFADELQRLLKFKMRYCCFERYFSLVDNFMPGVAGVGIVCSLSLLISGCVVSNKPLFDSSTRTMPFASESRYVVYQRDSPDQNWIRRSGEVSLRADATRHISVDGLFGDASDPKSNLRFNTKSGMFTVSAPEKGYTIHTLGDNFYVVVSEHPKLYSYTTLEIRDKEVWISGLFCDDINRDQLRKSGGSVAPEIKIGNVCHIDNIRDPVTFIKDLARHPKGPQLRFVMSKKN